MAKGQDGFTPLGAPAPVDGFDLDALTLRTRVNGEVVQEDSTANLLFPFGLLIADLSRFVTLEPGDVILTGTPAGSRPVEPGDEIEVELEGIGRVRNRVVESDAPLAGHGAQPKVSAAVRGEAWGTGAPRPHTLSDAARAALLEVSTATLTTQLRARGIANTFMAGLRPTRPDLRLLGYAYTLRYVPLREDFRAADTAELNAQKRAVESIGPDEVLVIDARGEAGAGTIGDILAARALARGATGIVTDGGLRDSPAVGALDIPTYYQAPHAAVLGLLHHPLEANVPIACGGTLVVPGDVIVGDARGRAGAPGGARRGRRARRARAGAPRGLGARARQGRRVDPRDLSALAGAPSRLRTLARGAAMTFAADPASIRGAITPLVTPFAPTERSTSTASRRSSTGSSSRARTGSRSAARPVSRRR